MKKLKRSFIEIGNEIFHALMESETPLTLTELQKKLSTHFNTIKKHLEYITFVQSMPKLTITGGKNRMEVSTEKSEISDREFLREMIGSEMPPRIELLILLLDVKAFTPHSGIPISEFSENELRILKRQKKTERVRIENNKVYLTDLGKTIAQSSKEYYSSL